MITTAIIPVAGRATRLAPLSRVVPKALLPLPHPAGLAVPVVHWICAEAAAAGVEQAVLVISPSQREMLEAYFSAVGPDHPLALPPRIRIVVQREAGGFGQAVMLAADIVGQERFLLLLGDHVYAHTRGTASCAAQVVATAGRHGEAVAMIGVQSVPTSELAQVGVVRGIPIDDHIYRCTDFIEKPGEDMARRRLMTPGLGEGEHLAHCGIYVFGPQVFDCLSALAAGEGLAGGELELAAAQSMLLKRYSRRYLLRRIDGKAYDTGMPAGYAETFTTFARQSGIGNPSSQG